jgi:NADPH-dependent 2,4-dienoyl-CoA reductase/sulfur reductase-like enzyme/nitrite reductase/ring-hydroxylating ferredoxin subunit
VSQEVKLSGPDLAAGIAESELVAKRPLLGHAHGVPIILVRAGAHIRAVGARCSHYGGPLAQGLVVGETIRCPWHHACFDLRTGDALSAPALDPIGCYEVARRGGRITVGPGKVPVSPRPPPKSPGKIVLVGAGAAGAAAAERLRHLGYDGSITLIGNEAPGPVDRPNLSKDFLAGTAPVQWVPLRSDEFYDKLGINLIKGETVVDLDAAAKAVTLGSGPVVSWDALLLATGAEPLRPPIRGANLPHVFTLRTLTDAQNIIMASAIGRRVVIVGSGFIGLEVAASLRARKLDVHVVSRDRVPLERVLGEQLGRFVQGLHEEHGVHFHLGATLQAIHPNTVELQDGRALAADLVVLGVGVQPRTALARKAGLEVDDGIIVNSLLRTSAPDIWAAGDVARYPELQLGTTARIEHWVVAQRHGQAVAADMLGLGTSFSAVPFFWSRHYDVSLRHVGHADSGASIEVTGSLQARDATVIFRHAAPAAHARRPVKRGRVAAVITIGRDLQSLAVEAALERNDESAVEELLRDRIPSPRRIDDCPAQT